MKFLFHIFLTWHSDHQVIDVISTCTKNFRFPFIKKILAMKFFRKQNLILIEKSFFPNHYEDISNFLSKKKNAMKI